MSIRWLLPASTVLLAAMACSADHIVVPSSGSSSTAPLVAIVSGNQQQTAVGTRSTTPLVVKVTTASGAPVPGAQVTFAVTSGGGSVSPSTTTTDANGTAAAMFTGGSSPGTTQVVATVQNSGAQATFTLTTVAQVSLATSCDTAGPSLSLTLGTVRTGLPSTGICVAGGSTGSEYTLIAFNSSTVPSATVSLDVIGRSIGVPVPTGNVLPSASRVFAEADGALTPDEGFHTRLREQATRTLAPGIGAARSWYDQRLGSRSGISAAVIPSTLNVGDLITLNANANDPCARPAYHAARVMAISNNAVVVSDTLNPAGGFTQAEYASIATTFDTLVYPVDVPAFGTPSDIDGNGKVLIFYTRSVNEMTPRGSTSYIGGFFDPRDLYPTTSTSTMGSCAGSNQGEMFYMLVPDSLGQVNGNVRTKTMVRSVTISTIAHEFQHLINSSRRMYINKTGAWDEEVWLNEGLSHVAEELIFDRASGRTPRQNIDLATLRSSQVLVDAFNQHMVANAQRYRSYLAQPSMNSPYAPNDSLPTRGATWDLLRYLADHRAPTDGDVWFQLVNSPTTGMANLQNVFGADLMTKVRDWATSNYTDDLLPSITEPWQEPSWNFRSILPAIGGFPLPVVILVDQASSPTTLMGGGVGYFHFAVQPGRIALINVTSSGAAAPAGVQFSLVRTR